MPYAYGNYENTWNNWNNWNVGNTWNVGMNNWNAGWNMWGASNSSSSGSTKEKTDEEIRIEKRKKYEQNQQIIKGNKAKIEELNQKLAALGQGMPDEQGNINPELSEENVNAQLKALQNGQKKEDGSIAICDGKTFDQMSRGDKIKRGAMNALTGIGNVFKSLAGYDKDGKWNPVKCAINVGIAAGVVALCATGVLAPAGAALAASLGGGAVATALGTTVASLPAILCATGVATGGYMAAKGAVNTYKACKNGSLEEFDNATQDIGAGVFIGGSSAMGLKSMGNAAGLTGAARFNPFAIGRATMNTAAESMITAAGESVVYNTNAAGNPTSVSLKNINSSLWKGEYFNAGRKAVLSMPAENANKKFEATLNDTKQKLWNEAADLDARIQTASASGDTKTVAALKMKQDAVLNNLNSLEDAKDYTSWKAVMQGNKANTEQFKNYTEAFKKDGYVEINGHKFNTEAELKAVLKEVAKENKNIAKMIKSLREERFLSMRKLACTEKHVGEAKSFGFSDSHSFSWEGIKGQLTNIWKAFSGKYDSKLALSKGIVTKGAMQSFIIMDPTYLAYEVAGPGKFIPNIATCFASPHEINADKVLTAEEAIQSEAQLTAIQKHYADARAALTKEKEALEDANKKLIQNA